MKILMVTRETRAEKRYGLGRSLLPLVKELACRGITVAYICQSDLGPRSVRWQHRLYRLLAAFPRIGKTDTNYQDLLHILLERLNMGRVAAKFAMKQKVTHVHCHDPIIAAGFRFFSWFRPNCRIVWGVTEHGFGCYAQAIYEDGIQIGRYVMRVMRYWEARTLLAAAWVIAPTRRGIAQIARDLGVSPIPANWRHVAHARPTLNRYSKRAAREQLGWHADTVYVLGVGRIAAVKQFPLLIEACAKLKTKKDFKLVILGEGDGSSLQKQAQQLGFTSKIQFNVTENIGLYLCAADLYVSASASESFGMANLEALTAGTPAICTAVGGVPDVVGDGALLVAPSSIAIANAMQRMLDDHQLRESIAQKGLERAKIWPDITKITDLYEAIYRQASAGQNSPTGRVSTSNITDSH